VQVVAAFLAAEARPRNGVLDVVGGFPEFWNLAILPCEVTMALVLLVELDRDERDRTVDLGLLFSCGDDETNLPSVSVAREPPIDFVDGAPLYACEIINLVIMLERVGRCEFRVTQGDSVIATVPFVSRLIP
jgi:hypothetical protein